MKKILLSLFALLIALTVTSPPALAGEVKATATFVAGSGFYLTSPQSTDGLSQVGGWVTFTQEAAGAAITVHGRLSGLAPTSLYVAVVYKDSLCLPVVGVTAFPSGAFATDATGKVRIPSGVTVNPRAINPLGVVNVSQTHSVSVRRVLVSALPVPPVPGYPAGLPAGTPTVPNGAAVESCDRTPHLH